MATELSFHERMEGFFAAGVKDPIAAAAAGEANGTRLAFEVTIHTSDLDRFVDDPKHTADVTGFYQGNFAPLGGKPWVQVGTGIFNFMSPGPGQQKLMEHHHLFEVDGARYRLDGYKHLDHDPGSWDEWYDLTTLFTTIASMDPGEVFEPYAEVAQAKIVAAGITRFPAKDTLKLMRSFEVRGTSDPLAAKLKFLRLFLGSEAEVLFAAFEPYDLAHQRRTLSKPNDELAGAYDVVVVGSGYGGGVAAARLSKSGTKTVCLLERGREYLAGDFPDEAWEIPYALKNPENPLGLFEFHLDPNIKALVGNGLGGTSLINANVMIRPEPGVLTTAPWPTLPNLDPYYARAESVLTPMQHPAPPLKSIAFRRAAEAAGMGVYDTGLVPIAVTFSETVREEAGLTQSACSGCGGCVTGCNFAAKNSTDMNYVAIAEKQGAAVFTRVEVQTLEPDGSGGFIVHAFDHQRQMNVDIRAKQVVLSAGTYGTFGILARSRDAHALAMSPKLGVGFSGNGDVLGFGYNTALRTQVTEGCTITSVARYAKDEEPRHRLMIQEGGIPRALVPLLRAALPIAGLFDGLGGDHGFWNAMKGLFRASGDVLGFEQNGAMNHSFLYFAMGFEQDTGTLRLENGKIAVSWPNVDNEDFAKRADERMLAITKAAQGTYVDNPLSRQFLGDSLITAHPVGGCAMAADSGSGVVDAKGEVFGHPGLFVADGSIFATPIGANPALTIAALAEWISEQIVLGW
ncbi:hypothetical protein BH09MYX1_BH09MYX1_30970 [soil metagenome]